MKKFDKCELEATGFYPAVGEYYGYGPDYVVLGPKYQFPATPKENFMLFMNRKEFYWVPNDMNDINLICPDVVPDFPACGLWGGIDSFGVTWIPTKPEEFLPSFVKPGDPLLKDIEDWKNVIQIPDVDSWDWEASGKMYMEGLDPDRPNVGVILSGFFERLISLMDFEEAAVSLVSYPEETNELMEVFCDFNISVLEHYKKYYNIDAVLIHDDWGAQRAPFFSRATLQNTILPHFTRFNKRAHELNVFTIHHCCGCSGPFIEDMIACGSDMWQVQGNANPNLLELMEKYGDQILFDPYGCAVPAEMTDPEEVRHFIEAEYKREASSKRAFYSAMGEDYESPLDFNGMGYEAARKICTGEL